MMTEPIWPGMVLKALAPWLTDAPAPPVRGIRADIDQIEAAARAQAGRDGFGWTEGLDLTGCLLQYLLGMAEEATEGHMLDTLGRRDREFSARAVRLVWSMCAEAGLITNQPVSFSIVAGRRNPLYTYISLTPETRQRIEEANQALRDTP